VSAPQATPQPAVLVLATGGTIAARGDSPAHTVHYRAGQIGVQALLQAVPDLAGQAQGPVLARQIAQIDSKDIDWPLWRTLLAECMQALHDDGIRAIVITHGSDTLEETAWLLHRLLPAHKPVVLTCAMRPPTALLADGAQNLRDAVTVATCGARAGVWVVAAGEVHAAARVQKVHPHRLHALRSLETGAAARVEEGRVRWLLPPTAPAPGHAALHKLLALPALPWVEIIFSGALVRGEGVNALVAAGVRGLVVAGSGNATVHQALETALLRARAQGVWVWRTTRCAEGLPVAPAHPGGQAALPLAALPPATARIAMMLALAGAIHPVDDSP